MTKKTIIIFGIIGAFSCVTTFGIMFGIHKMRDKKNAEQTGESANGGTSAAISSDFSLETQAGAQMISGLEPTQPTLEEKQIGSLIVDLKTTKKNYEDKLAQLKSKEERLEKTRLNIEADMERIRAVKAEIINTISELKLQKASLEKTITEVKAVEKDNLVKLAACYDKMETDKAAQTVFTMMENSQIEDAAKLIYYMSDRNAAKLIGEIASKNSEYAAQISEKLKRVKEQDK